MRLTGSGPFATQTAGDAIASGDGPSKTSSASSTASSISYQELRQKVEELQDAHHESELRRQEIAAILDGITDIMMVLTQDLRIISVNHVFHEMFNVSRPEGQHCYRIFRGSTRPCPECPAHKSFRNNTVCRCMGTFRIGGMARQFEMVASPIHNPDSPESRILIFKRDVTMEKQYEAKYYQAEKMAPSACWPPAWPTRSTIRSRPSTVWPRASAAGCRPSAPGWTTPCTPTSREYIETILMECRRCRDIVRSMLSFSRPHTLAFSPVTPKRGRDDTLSILRGHLDERGRSGLTLTVNLSEALPLVPGDEAQLKQVLLNLLTNPWMPFPDRARSPSPPIRKTTIP